MPKVTINDLRADEADLIAIRHDLHQHPELGFQESRTANIVADYLKNIGLEVHENIGGTGVVGVLRGGNDGPQILLRADMDALPIAETSQHNYSSKNDGVMHACGHDGHTTMLLGAAKCLASMGGLHGTVYFLFQPNEEHGLGASAMLNDGVLRDFPADEVYAIHNLPGAPLGEFSTRVGNICASETLFDITIQGQGGHASMPQVGVDAILVGADLVTSLQTIVARKMAPNAGCVVSVTEFETDGGRNILPGRAVLRGDTRARTPADREEIERFMRQICAGVANVHDVEIDVKIWTEFVETINAQAPCDAAMAAAQGLGLNTIPDRAPMSFSEDFAHFAAAKPGCFVLMGNGTDGSNGQPLHASDYDFNDDALIIGAAFWARLAQDRLSKPK
jgi:hippurate hydrolase